MRGIVDFFQVKTVQQVKEIIRGFAPLETESVRLQDAWGRVVASDLVIQGDMPPCDRSTMDGYALQAKDTFGASEGSPALLEVTGEILMGETPAAAAKPGEAVKIPTGGVLPEGADAVVMVEHTQLIDEHTLQVYRSAAPGENVMQQGEDLKAGERILEQGLLLRPQELGLLALVGSAHVAVYRQPKVGIIATVDEIVPIDATPTIGQLRDYLFISDSSTSELVARLVKRGFVTRSRSQTDHRVVLVALTPAGRRIASQIPLGGIPLLRERLKTLPRERLALIDEATSELLQLLEDGRDA